MGLGRSAAARRVWALLLAGVVLAVGSGVVRAEDTGPSYATEEECEQATGKGCYVEFSDWRYRPLAGEIHEEPTNFSQDWIDHMSRVTPANVSGTQEHPVVMVDMEQVIFPDVQPVLDPAIGRVRVPVRFVSEKMGATVTWEQITKTVTIERDKLVITMQVDNPTVMVNGETKTMDAPPVLTGDRVLVPLRYISELYGSAVDWVDNQPPAGEDATWGTYQVWVWIPWGYWGTANLETRIATSFFRRN